MPFVLDTFSRLSLMPFVLDTFSCLRDSVVVLFNMSCGILGDVNRDGAVDFFDISGFISALSSGSFQCEADINMDGVVDFFDISHSSNCWPVRNHRSLAGTVIHRWGDVWSSPLGP